MPNPTKNISGQLYVCAFPLHEGIRAWGRGGGPRRQTWTQAQPGRGSRAEEMGDGCYTPTMFPFACVCCLGGTGLRGRPAGAGWAGRGASAEFPLTLMCSHPPWKPKHTEMTVNTVYLLQLLYTEPCRLNHQTIWLWLINTSPEELAPCELERQTEWSDTHPYAIVPGLALGLHGPHSQPVADGSRSLTGETWNPFSDDPHLQQPTASIISMDMGYYQQHFTKKRKKKILGMRRLRRNICKISE